MYLSIWLGIILAGGETGCTTLNKSAKTDVAETRRAEVPAPQAPSVAPSSGVRNPDYYQIPKVPPPGARVAYNSVNITEPYIAITFDDGPHATNTPRLLNMLKERNIKATFYVVGQCAREYPQIIRRILAEGHEIGNHTWSHKSLPTLSESGVRDQITQTDKAVRDAAGYHMRTMRPPYGATTLRLKQWFHDEYGYPTILWSVDPFDWKRPGSGVIKDRILAGTRPGGIILCHDIHEQTINAMPGTLDALLARGFKFLTVSQLLNMESSRPLAANTTSAPALQPGPAPAPTPVLSPATVTPPTGAPAPAPPAGIPSELGAPGASRPPSL